MARYPSTVSTRASRCSQVSARAWESSGSPPGAPATSRTSRSTRPGSRFRPTSRAGSSIAARSSSLSQRCEQQQPAFGEVGQLRAVGQPPEVVGAQGGDHPGAGLDPGGQPVEERPSGIPVAVVGEHLLELVDDQQPARVQPGDRRGQPRQRVGARGDHPRRVTRCGPSQARSRPGPGTTSRNPTGPRPAATRTPPTVAPPQRRRHPARSRSRRRPRRRVAIPGRGRSRSTRPSGSARPAPPAPVLGVWAGPKCWSRH